MHIYSRTRCRIVNIDGRGHVDTAARRVAAIVSTCSERVNTDRNGNSDHGFLPLEPGCHRVHADSRSGDVSGGYRSMESWPQARSQEKSSGGANKFVGGALKKNQN